MCVSLKFKAIVPLKHVTCQHAVSGYVMVCVHQPGHLSEFYMYPYADVMNNKKVLRQQIITTALTIHIWCISATMKIVLI